MGGFDARLGDEVVGLVRLGDEVDGHVRLVDKDLTLSGALHVLALVEVALDGAARCTLDGYTPPNTSTCRRPEQGAGKRPWTHLASSRGASPIVVMSTPIALAARSSARDVDRDDTVDEGRLRALPRLA